jgi:Transglutaminase-like superfamily
MAAEYGVEIPEQRKRESHIRQADEMLDRILAIDGSPLTIARPPEKRLVGVCQHFSTLIVAMLRAKGIPARARHGFGSYFNPGYFEDHVLCEYWNAAEDRWVLADPQFDELWQRKLNIDHNVLDVPRDRFLIAGDAWKQYRSGKADPLKFGIIVGNLRGVWFIAGDLVRDVAALNEMEMLPWDQWGAMPRPDESLSDDQLAFYDRLADLTQVPDRNFGSLRELHDGDERVRVPTSVFNALLNRSEEIRVPRPETQPVAY